MMKINIKDGRRFKGTKTVDPLMQIYRHTIDHAYPNWDMLYKNIREFSEAKNLTVSDFYMNKEYYINVIQPRLVRYFIRNGELKNVTKRTIEKEISYYNLNLAPNFGESLNIKLEPGYVYVKTT